MKVSPLSIIFASACGGFLGAIVAIRLGSWWPFGIAAGALLGYIAQDPTGAWQASHKAWRITTEPHPECYRETYYWLKLWSVMTLAALCVLSTFVSLLIALIWASEPSKPHVSESLRLLGFPVWGGAAIGIAFTLMVCSEPRPELSRKKALKVALHGNPIGACFWIIFGIIWAIIHIPAGLMISLPWIYKLVVAVVCLMHTTWRQVCLMDAAIGGVYGWFYKDAALGALVGGLAGGLHWLLARAHIEKLRVANRAT